MKWVGKGFSRRSFIEKELWNDIHHNYDLISLAMRPSWKSFKHGKESWQKFSLQDLWWERSWLMNTKHKNIETRQCFRQLKFSIFQVLWRIFGFSSLNSCHLLNSQLFSTCFDVTFIKVPILPNMHHRVSIFTGWMSLNFLITPSLLILFTYLLISLGRLFHQRLHPKTFLLVFSISKKSLRRLCLMIWEKPTENVVSIVT